MFHFRNRIFHPRDPSTNNDPRYSSISREDVTAEPRATRRNVKTTRHRGFDAIKKKAPPLERRANICAMPIWRAIRARVSISSWRHQRVANEARDVASLWKRRGLTSILKRRCVHPPSPGPLRRPCPPSALFLHPGLRALYICLLHSKLETGRGARADPGSARATPKRWRIAMNIHRRKAKLALSHNPYGNLDV